MNAQPSWENVKNLLCIRLDSLGDVLMTTPAIRALKESFPGSKITLLTSENGAQIAPFISEIDDVIQYNAPWMKSTTTIQDSRHEYKMAARLQQSGFDAAVIFTVYSQSALPAALLCHLADIPLVLAHNRENPYQLISNWIKDPEPTEKVRHEVQRQLDLVKAVGATAKDESLSLTTTNQDTRRANLLLRKNEIDPDKPWVVIHPGASAPSRRYDPESYAQVADSLVKDFDVQVVFTGNKEERVLVNKIRSAMKHPAVSLSGELEVGELAALIELAPMIITNNTGPAHIAAAVKTPIVDLYALTNPQHTPWMVPNRVLFHDVPCKYCYRSVCPEKHHNCLRLVEPEMVVRAVLELFEEATQYHVKDLEAFPVGAISTELPSGSADNEALQ